MGREAKSTGSPASVRGKATLAVVTGGDAAIVSVSGLVDEHFEGFGSVNAKAVVLDVSGITRMTSFGVRQWLKAIDTLPKQLTDLYLLGCPTFFVDQLNMVLNFGGASKVLSVVAPYTCPSCGVESGEVVDVLAERANLASGSALDKECSKCGGKLEFDETPESYFSFVGKYGATAIHAAAAELLAAHGRYRAVETVTEKPPRIIKLVHGSVTYFRIIGTVGGMFRARPFLVGAEGEIVIDLAEVDRFELAGQKEWRRLLKTLSAQVPAVTLVDVTEALLLHAGDSLAIARTIAVASVLVAHTCAECGRVSQHSVNLLSRAWPPKFEPLVCGACGGTTTGALTKEALVPLHKASTSAPDASVKLIEQRDELMSRALTDANVARAGDGATAAIGADDMILGKYKIVRRLSAGGMAEVFLATQVGIGGFEKPVALKRIHHKLLESRHQAIELFLNEAKIAGRLTHPNIVQVLDVGEVAGSLYLAMEYVHGRDLRDLLKHLHRSHSIMPLAEACYVAREVAQALHHAYWSTDMAGKQVSVVHRDVSPHNVILGYDGAVKLLDFGVAMSAVTEHAETMIVGKWMYMSPEATMNKQVDHRSDLYSLGVVLYLLCSGAMPFSGREPKEIVKKIRAGQYKRLSEIAPQVPDRLAALVGKLLAADPESRPQRGQEVVTELTEIMRQYGLESSGQAIASYVAQVLPDQMLDAGGENVREIVRVYPEGGDGAPGAARISATIDKSPISITPSAGTASKLVDVSETFRRSTSIPVARATGGTPVPRFDPPTPLPSTKFPPAPKKRGASVGKMVLWLAIAIVLGAVAYLSQTPPP